MKLEQLHKHSTPKDIQEYIKSELMCVEGMKNSFKTQVYLQRVLRMALENLRIRGILVQEKYQ